MHILIDICAFMYIYNAHACMFLCMRIYILCVCFYFLFHFISKNLLLTPRHHYSITTSKANTHIHIYNNNIHSRKIKKK